VSEGPKTQVVACAAAAKEWAVNWDELRKVAEAAHGKTTAARDEWQVHVATFTPSTVLRLLDLAQRAEAAEALHRDLVSRLGFGNNITEPMADNDTVVTWVEALDADASEWRESQRWRDECYAAGHPDDEDCYEHDPARRLEAAAAAVERVRALLPNECWVLRSDARGPTCIELIGGGLPNGSAKWTEDMCCLPCRLRAALDPAPASEVRDDAFTDWNRRHPVQPSDDEGGA
jgi:hypothetical protein